MIKAIVFDFGGVVRKPGIMKHIYTAVGKKYGIDRQIVRMQFHKLEQPVITGKISMKQFWLRLGELLGVEWKGLERVWIRTYAKGVGMNKRVLQILGRIKKKGYNLSLLSNEIPSHAEFNERHGYYKSFQNVFLSHSVGLKKPDRRIFIHVLHKLKIKPADCLFIDDHVENIATAEKLGIRSILFENTSKFEKDIKNYL
ncbi:MAG: HAD family phosphatase [Candidatus Aenigmarchaeota archaeon]|nr:HAD family phosphatase [Candidatus Aenigmarchaeota archaeon]